MKLLGGSKNKHLKASAPDTRKTGARDPTVHRFVCATTGPSHPEAKASQQEELLEQKCRSALELALQNSTSLTLTSFLLPNTLLICPCSLSSLSSLPLSPSLFHSLPRCLSGASKRGRSTRRGDYRASPFALGRQSGLFPEGNPIQENLGNNGASSKPEQLSYARLLVSCLSSLAEVRGDPFPIPSLDPWHFVWLRG